MFCPNCGSNQGNERRYCTICGTNLLVVSQALSGGLPQTSQYIPPAPDPYEHKRQKQLARGVTQTIIGGVLVAMNLFSFIFRGPFRGGSQFWTFVGFVLLALGISKIINSRPSSAEPPQTTSSASQHLNTASPQPVFSRPSTAESYSPHTNELEPVQYPVPSVTEDETRNLQRHAPSK
jgi:hypothetical protein